MSVVNKDVTVAWIEIYDFIVFMAQGTGKEESKKDVVIQKGLKAGKI
jgi:hypothetical protein